MAEGRVVLAKVFGVARWMGPRNPGLVEKPSRGAWGTGRGDR